MTRLYICMYVCMYIYEQEGNLVIIRGAPCGRKEIGWAMDSDVLATKRREPEILRDTDRQDVDGK